MLTNSAYSLREQTYLLFDFLRSVTKGADQWRRLLPKEASLQRSILCSFGVGNLANAGRHRPIRPHRMRLSARFAGSRSVNVLIRGCGSHWL